MKSLIINARFTLGKVEREYHSDTFLDKYAKFALVMQVSDMLDRLAPEGLYFGAKYDSTDDYGYWNANTLVGPFVNFL